ncbi:hypothetical protein KAFR_0K00570 [Kazachstania africana CBS 2517]|uniref:Ribonuclease P/MRP protein subunit POP5 n=1 Tax=Kazachstania africana (strain ATCC 22294 / BCRC 22015 / CBS 2517 / CECT 1963 / NBRC 1671 / NRRL Y-8276) TaxID=1071382 RepID=H2B1B2_KAZAF|nr:hypothetical protein KAFR_0K00570 [Kazachstania africana CBS 2517]CCF60412.1 hypothetical protein KAFR_0K00570 [Kazachstania africana CBS 2517]
MVRLKSRYILFEILFPPTEISEDELVTKKDILLSYHKVSPPDISSKSILQEIRRSLQLNLGDYGYGKVNSLLQLKYFSNNTSTGILRCHREDTDLLLTALFTISKINEITNLIINPIKVSGTIKKIEQYSIRRNAKFLSLIKADSSSVLTNDFTNVNEDDNDEL